MFKNKAPEGRCNLCGTNVMKYRVAKVPKCSQQMLASQLQILGLDVGKNAIQRIESGERFVTDIELVALARALNKTVSELLEV